MSAEEIRRPARRVGIKVPHPEMECDPVFFDRFQRAAQIGRELVHPGVMKVMPDDSNGRVYMVMEWLEGRLLRHLPKSSRSLWRYRLHTVPGLPD